MSHPILRRLKSLYAYFFIWILITSIHAVLLTINQHNFGQHGLGRWLLIDSVVFNGLFAAFGISFWYPCKYISLERSRWPKIMTSHLFGSIFISIVWIGLAYGLLTNVLRANQAYLDFLRSSIPWRFLIGILFYFAISSLYYVFIFSENLKEQLTKEAELKSLVKEAELKSLRFQINPHFIFNSLNSINSLTMTDPQKAGDMTIKLGEYLRYSLAKNDKQMTRLKDEIDSVKLYLEIEKVRFGDKIEFSENIDPDCFNVLVPSMILQPLFENAIKYGVYESLDRVCIRLACMPYGDFLKISVENNFEPESGGKKGEGIGLKNIKARLTTIYNQGDLLSIERNSNVFKVNLLIPTA